MGDDLFISYSETPHWLDISYIESIMKNFTNNTLNEIKSCRINAATSKGENYFGVLYQLTVHYMDHATGTEGAQEISFIVKTRLENDIMLQMEDVLNVFQREKQYYTVINLEFEKLLRSIKDDTFLAPRLIYVDENSIVMENLKLRNYGMHDVKEGLSFKQCHLVVQKLAKFHALSMVLHNKDTEMFRYHMPGNITEKPTSIHCLYKNAAKSCVEYCRDNEKLKIFTPKLLVFADNILKNIVNVYTRSSSDRFHVLNHGDLWVNNIMFADQQEQEDVLFVDFQESYYGSPGIDWNCFIFSSWQPEVFINHFEELVKSYHVTLSNSLNKLNYSQPTPTLDDVKREILNKGMHGLVMATCALPLYISEYAHEIDLEKMISDSVESVCNRRLIYNNAKLGQRLEVYLKYFVDNNIL